MEENLNENAIQSEDATQLDELILYIEERLKKIPRDENNASTSSSATKVTSSVKLATSIESGRSLVEKVQEGVTMHIRKKSFLLNLGRVTNKVVIELLNEANSMVPGLSVVAYVLQQIDQHINEEICNRGECVKLLGYMCNLAKHIKQLENRLPKEKLNKVLQFVVEGSYLCLTQMQAGKFSRFFSASVDADDLQSLQSQFGHVYPDLTMEALTVILKQIPTRLPPSQGSYDSDAVGLDEPRDKVIELLKLTEKQTRAVVLYGVGGIGKTTLATSVFHRLRLNGYEFCRIDMDQYCSDIHLMRLQQQILEDVYGKKLKLRGCVEGREQLLKAFKEKHNKPIFVFIDNALNGSDLEKLLPKDLSSLPLGSRILLTTRKLNETDILLQPTIQRYDYSVNTLSPSDAKKLVCKKALGSADATFDKGIDIGRLITMSGGIPLVLEMMGSHLRKHGNNVDSCNETIRVMEGSILQGEGELSENIVDVVYNSLREPLYEEAFLDIACFFHNWERRIVSYIVGEIELKALEEAALVKISEEGSLNVHDIVRARGRKLSESSRFTDLESLKLVLKDAQKLQKVKGIHIAEEFNLEADYLDLMSPSARVLDLKSIYISGRCQRRFGNLRFLQISSLHYFHESQNFRRLAVLYCREISKDSISQLPHSLRALKIGQYSSVALPEETIGSLGFLEEFQIAYAYRLQTLPENFGELKCLRYLKLKGNDRITKLPQSFGDLCSLRELHIRECHLESLPDTFGNLFSLETLYLHLFRKLESLPESFGNLSSLKVLHLRGCSCLKRLPSTMGQLKSLQKLCLNRCVQLASLPPTFCELNNLTQLEICGCALPSLPDKFGHLKSLKYLNISDSYLESLGEDFGMLTSLVAVAVCNCSTLDRKAMDKLVEVESLRMLNISGSPMLTQQWQEIKERHPLLVHTQTPYKMQRSEYEHVISATLFDAENKFLTFDRVVSGWPSVLSGTRHDNRVTILFTMRDLSSSSNRQASELVKKRIAELARDAWRNYCFLYVYVGVVEEEHIRRSFEHVFSGISSSACALMLPHHKSNQMLAYSAFQIISQFRTVPNYFGGVHSFIVSGSISDFKGRKNIEDLNLELPYRCWINEFTSYFIEADSIVDFGGSFYKGFSALRNTDSFTLGRRFET